MRRLAPNLFNRRFDNLVETGRSRLPSLAPRWTDYNAHDPGITLMELLAFVAEAQMYSLARMRRDERTGYAALLGLHRRGPQPACGALWPERSDPDSPFLSYQQPVVIEADSLVRTAQEDSPAFHPTHRILWTAGRITRLRALLADGREMDFTHANTQGDRAFEAFGPSAGGGDTLRMDYQTLGDRGLFPAQRAQADKAVWTVGVRVAPALSAVSDEDADTRTAGYLSVEMRLGAERIELPVIADGTRGFMQSGVLLLDVAAVPGSPREFALEIRAPRGFARPPRILMLEPGVLPIEQGGTEIAQAHAATGVPDQRIELAVPGLRFGEGSPATRVVVNENGERREWQRVDDLSKSAPGDRVYELDVERESVYLGNGINGYAPETGSAIGVDYAYCGGAAGNTPRRQHWNVRGISGVFGVNPDPISGGLEAENDIDLRRVARTRLASAHALVTAADLERAARQLPDLEVARAEVMLPKARPDATRELTLLALRARVDGDEPPEAPETSRWLAAVRRGLVARMPLATRLTVRAPDYRTFTLAVTAEAQPRRNPREVEAAIRQKLRDAFVLIRRQGLKPRIFGAPVTPRDLTAQIRRVPGVRRITALELRVDGRPVDVLKLGRFALPRLDLAASPVTVERAGTGGAP